MTYKTICTVISDAQTDTDALEAAITLASTQDGHLHVVCVGVDPIRYDMAPLGAAPALTIAANSDAHNRAQALEAWATKRLQNSSVAFDVQPLVVMSGGFEAAVARVTRYCDVVVVTQPYAEGCTQLQTSVLKAVLFGTGAPVLVVPKGKNLKPGFDRIMIAWNESDEALEAVRKALPVLQAANRVSVVLIDPPDHSQERSDPGGAICEILTRHGVRVDVSILARTLPRVSDVIKRFALENDQDLIVMGAYGHSRFREALMGGATRDMLEASDRPVLMAH